MSDKAVKTIILAGVLVLGAWFAWRYYQNWKAGQAGGGVPQLGTNLNSMAPELVGGSTGPAVAPAVNTPINITITDNTQRGAMPESPNVPMVPGGPIRNPVTNSNEAPGSAVPEDAAMQEPLINQGGQGY